MPIESWDVAGAKLRVRTAGKGDALVLLATDPPNVVEAYAQLCVALGPHARVAVFEPPGFGRSRAPKGFAHTWAEQARVIEAILERTGPAVLAFPCVAAYAAMLVAASRPDLVRGLVLAQAPSWSDERAWMDRVDRRRLVRTPVVGQALMMLRSDDIARRWFEAATGDVDKMRPLAALAVEALSHDAKFPLAAAFQAMEREVPPLSVIDKPALLVWGDKDRTHARSDPRGLMPFLPRAKHVTLEGAGHFPELERPREFADAVTAWMHDELSAR